MTITLHLVPFDYGMYSREHLVIQAQTSVSLCILKGLVFYHGWGGQSHESHRRRIIDFSIGKPIEWEGLLYILI